MKKVICLIVINCLFMGVVAKVEADPGSNPFKSRCTCYIANSKDIHKCTAFGLSACKLVYISAFTDNHYCYWTGDSDIWTNAQLAAQTNNQLLGAIVNYSNKGVPSRTDVASCINAIQSTTGVAISAVLMDVEGVTDKQCQQAASNHYYKNLISSMPNQNVQFTVGRGTCEIQWKIPPKHQTWMCYAGNGGCKGGQVPPSGARIMKNYPAGTTSIDSTADAYIPHNQ